MSSPNHPTSGIEDAFSSNFPDYIPISLDYVPASPGNTYSSSSNNSFGSNNHGMVRVETKGEVVLFRSSFGYKKYIAAAAADSWVSTRVVVWPSVTGPCQGLAVVRHVLTKTCMLRVTTHSGSSWARATMLATGYGSTM
ncbi:hypothetical protein Tco_1138784, partial [Tanacetum coccineum]